MFDLDLVWGRYVRIHILVQTNSELMNIELPRPRFCNANIVDLVGQVLEPNQDLVAVYWYEDVGLIIREIDCLFELLRIR